MKRFFVLFLSLVLVLGSFAGCKAQPGTYIPSGDALLGDKDPIPPTKPPVVNQEDFALVYYPGKPMNPYLATDHTNRAILPLIYQGLFAVSSSYEVVPILCQSYTMSADMKTYTFHLASEALFSDGSPVTAADAVASLNAAKGSPWYGGRLQHVTTISGFGSAVLIELDTPMENLPILLDIPIVKASQVDIARPIGSGPYRLDTAEGGLRRQAAWWCDTQIAIQCDFIKLVTAESTNQIRDAFEFQGVSLVCTDPAASDYVDFRSDYELWGSENGLFLFLACNGKSKIFTNPAIRSALTYAIDRKMLADEYYHGFAQAASLPASPASPWYDEDLADKYSYDPEKFAQIISSALESGDLETNEITLLLNSSDVVRHRVGNAIVKMLEAGGLRVKVVTATAANFTEALKQGQYDLYLGQTRLSQNMDLSAFFAKNGAMNYGSMTNPSIYAIGLEALANAGNYYDLHELVMEDGQLCPILFQSYALYTDRGILPNLEPARDNLFFYDLGRTLEDAQGGVA